MIRLIFFFGFVAIAACGPGHPSEAATETAMGGSTGGPLGCTGAAWFTPLSLTNEGFAGLGLDAQGNAYVFETPYGKPGRVVRVSPEGAVVHTTGLPGEVEAGGVAADGRAYALHHGEWSRYTYVLSRLDPAGTLGGTLNLGDFDGYRGFELAVAPDGTLTLTDEDQGRVFRSDPLFTPIWDVAFAGAVEAANSAGLAVATGAVMLGADGSVMWSAELGFDARAVDINASGQSVAAGRVEDFEWGIASLDPDGKVVWESRVPAGGYGDIAVAINASGEVAVGTENSDEENFRYGVVLRYDAAGTLLATHTCASQMHPESIRIGDAGDIRIAGTFDDQYAVKRVFVAAFD